MTDRVAAAVEATDKDAFTIDERGAPIRQSTALRAITRLLRLLDAPERSRVLEIGTGSGYSTSLLAHLVGPNGRVVSIDVDPNLTRRAQTLLDAGGVTNVTLLTRDGIAGASEHAPYTHLISWTTPPLLPVTWIEQMAVGAVLVVPLPLASVERSTAIVRVRVDHPYAPHAECVAPGAFIPMHSPDAPPNIRLHRDLAACTGDLDNERSVRWISSQALRGDAAAATRLLDLLTAAPLEPSPLLGTKPGRVPRLPALHRPPDAYHGQPRRSQRLDRRQHF